MNCEFLGMLWCLPILLSCCEMQIETYGTQNVTTTEIQIAFPRSKLQFDKDKINWNSWEQTPAKYISREFIFWLSDDWPFSSAKGSISQKWIWQIPIINSQNIINVVTCSTCLYMSTSKVSRILHLSVVSQKYFF